MSIISRVKESARVSIHARDASFRRDAATSKNCRSKLQESSARARATTRNGEARVRYACASERTLPISIVASHRFILHRYITVVVNSPRRQRCAYRQTHSAAKLQLRARAMRFVTGAEAPGSLAEVARRRNDVNETETSQVRSECCCTLHSAFVFIRKVFNEKKKRNFHSS